ncbi:MAG: glycosyltransferase family 4 protein, partial [Brumimicrobium sp.]|nr:glycosyltransferase family 4 protein [Brumimicrobium sp.]
MNILFLTITRFTTIAERGIYTDLMRFFAEQGHKVCVVAPAERRFKKPTSLVEEGQVSILNVAIPNIQKTNVLEKGLSTLLLERLFHRAIKKHFSHIRFDLVIYSTPPITFTKIIREIKQRDNAHAYLLLKDIFPQNAVDLQMFKQGGMIHRFFYHKELALYRVSDYIGCMSPANAAFLLKHHPWLDPSHIEVNPNSTSLLPSTTSQSPKSTIRESHQLPTDKTIFVYGGNLGKPQGISFLLQTIENCRDIEKAFFLVIGSGTEYPRIQRWFDTHKPANATLIETLPKAEYDIVLAACDIGLIYLDPRFTIPNYPSRLLSYLENSMPIITATDPNTDIGTIAEENGYGLKCLSGDIETMKQHIKYCCENAEKVKEMGQKGYEFLKNNYTVQHSYD